ncbi:prolyl-tRNA synthetase [Clostridium carboxidivorans P7]|uniref:Proline--tRNA ligase n=1 Tax=Clostridium carboxidivorans P7 TaxID=536227 RepID=C6PZC9_9CLOT|nr:proline--tRNA ligase [Clostridium carboxidivorans]AKN33001.1 prolyl-tRNA synthetase [Clostridium carboxidivorans P7]EET85409.1 prolyl-tRNA synthetase [Clostridium carboxidivorans P7]
MKLSKMILGTLREAPGETELESYKLMVRAGIIRKVASGIYNFMPTGKKVIGNVNNLIKNEMEKIDSQEIEVSQFVPFELLNQCNNKESSLTDTFETVDKSEKKFYVGADFKEPYIEIVKNEIKSYKQLPVSIYSIQKQIKDEPKPKFGIIKSKEFNELQCYVFHDDLTESSQYINSLCEVFNSIYHKCRIDSIKTNSLRFFIKHPLGEEHVVCCESCGYKEDLEIATCTLQTEEEDDMKPMNKISTPDTRTIDELASLFNTTPEYFVKTIIYKINNKIVAVMVRGDREVNETKVKNRIGHVVSFELADEETVRYATSAEIGFAGPINLKCDTLLVDEEITRMRNFMVGANDTGYHYECVNYERDFTGTVGDFKKITEKDKCPVCGNSINIENAMGLGQIMNLKTTYSENMNAVFLDKLGKSKPMSIINASINIDRLLALIVEQNHDKNGIVWPKSVAPYEVIVIAAVFKNEEQMKTAENIYNKLKSLGIDVLLDDRDERAGVKFKDADLIGAPIRITVGKRISDGKVEFKLRNNDNVEDIDIDDIEEKVLSELHRN